MLIDSGLLTRLIIVRDYSTILGSEDPIKLEVVGADGEKLFCVIESRIKILSVTELT
jgi:hypothetical protein